MNWQPWDLGMGNARYVLLKRLSGPSCSCICRRSITKVAGQVGFNDPAYFARVFRREYKLSPSGYRKKYTGR
jgi:AraC-like DNA-binding protein